MNQPLSLQNPDIENGINEWMNSASFPVQQLAEVSQY